MRLIIVRHGETIENVNRIVQGQKLGTLSKKGKKQAELVSERLKDEKIDIIISSDLERARDTALAIAKHHPNTPIEYSELLREKNLSTFEGKPIDEYEKARKEAGLPRHLYKTPGGESYADLRSRGEKFLDYILDRFRDRTVLAVSHSAIIKAMLSAALNEPIEKWAMVPTLPNTVVTILEVHRDHKFEAEVLQSIEHLNGKL